MSQPRLVSVKKRIKKAANLSDTRLIKLGKKDINALGGFLVLFGVLLTMALKDAPVLGIIVAFIGIFILASN